MTFRQRELVAPDDHRIKVLEWRPAADSQPAAIVQILHGLGDHAARYGRFAQACNAHGLTVVAHNHRGHGATEGFGHFADAGGWDKVIADVQRVSQDIATRYPGLPVVLLGHSMGSFIAQCVTMRHRGICDALILSGSTLAPRVDLRISHAASRIAAALTGKRRVSKLLNHMGLGNMNRRFEPGRTGFEWISRDEDEVDIYVADPLCGGMYSNKLWADLTAGLLEVTSPASIQSVPADLPILILGGANDPVGGQKGLSRLTDAYRQTGHTNVSLKIYPGGHHEMLNETNRDEVTTDIINWIDSTLP